MDRKQKQVVDLIRIMGTDINSNSSILFGLAKIKGINIMFCNALCNVLKLDKNAKISSLTEKDLEKLENYLEDSNMAEIPSWLLNKRQDVVSGKNIHLVSKDIDFDMIQLKRQLGKLKTYKGLRHRARLPLRGQRTKSNFRRNKTIASMKSSRNGGKK